MAQLTLSRSQSKQFGGVKKSGFRPDVQGLRALAVLLVLVYHAGATVFPGGFVGVDVFFVISGFLITGILLKEAASSNSISITGFYARRAKRILPASTLVLIVVAAATFFILPRTRWDDTAWQIMASAFNVVNWLFAGSAVDYLNNDEAASPVQHFWTLAVEEQFYLLWPLLLAGCLFLAGGRSRRQRRRRVDSVKFKRWATIAVLAVTVPSLGFSAYYTAANPGAAYFVSTTRLWELGIGAMVAIFAPQLQRLGGNTSRLLGWGGLAAILMAGVSYSSSTPFPGVAACVPTLGAAAVIIAGMGGRDRLGVGRILSVSPATRIGDISYSLYLWHWPMIVIGTYLLGQLQLHQGLLIVAASFVPAYLSYRYVETPLKDFQQSDGDALQVGAVAILVTAVMAVGIMVLPKPAEQGVYVPPVASPGSAVSAPVALVGAELLAKDPSVGEPKDVVDAFMPSALEAANDNPTVYKDGCHQAVTEVEPEACTYGKSGADYRVAVVGDSHAAQWVPALTRLAKENAWQVDSYTKSSCPFVGTPIMAEGNTRVYDECTTWNSNVTKALTGPERPDLVLVTGQSYQTTGEQSFAQGLESAWTRLREASVPFAVLMDTPRPGINVPECVSTNPQSLTKCAVDREKAMANGSAVQREAAGAMGKVEEVDMTDSICPGTRCAPIVGKVLVYRDSNHLTATYSTTLGPALGARLAEIGAPVVKAPTASAPATQTDPKLVTVVGDSYVAGSDMGGVSTTNWTSLVAQQLQVSGPISLSRSAAGGSGYVAPGPKNIVFDELLTTSIGPKTDLIVFFGSINDSGANSAQVGMAAAKAYADAKKLAPNAKLVVFGPAWSNPKVPAKIIANSQALRSAAEAAGATWIDPIAELWFFDKPSLIGTDKTHPTDEGHAYMAKQILPHLAAALGKP
ncbi:SGNH hydrolase domain-containing protein [Arthrobacter sp. LAR12-1-1.1]|uniref:SGNH hydrolase domain-containing protein n=1 Tax=Arthrobacter sp. LAR12-1-1.1 TaxID=3135215 RepID=UPI00343569AA